MGRSSSCLCLSKRLFTPPPHLSALTLHTLPLCLSAALLPPLFASDCHLFYAILGSKKRLQLPCQVPAASERDRERERCQGRQGQHGRGVTGRGSSCIDTAAVLWHLDASARIKTPCGNVAQRAMSFILGEIKEGRSRGREAG